MAHASRLGQNIATNKPLLIKFAVQPCLLNMMCYNYEIWHYLIEIGTHVIKYLQIQFQFQLLIVNCHNYIVYNDQCLLGIIKSQFRLAALKIVFNLKI